MNEPTPNEDDLLLPFERVTVPEHYRPYLRAKRNNFFAGVQGSPNLWRFFGLLDLILFTEFQDMARATDTTRMVPLVLFLNAHAKIRVSMELVFSRCMEEARSILRDAIETSVFAHYMLGDPNLQRVWLSKDDGVKEATEFREAFEKDKKNRAFKGQSELYEQWGRLSETGAHSTPQAVVSRFVIKESGQDVHFALNYTGVEDCIWEPETFTRKNKTLLELGQRIRSHRKEKGWTQTDMAVNLDMGRTHISDIEQGKRDIGVITLQVIARGLDTKMSDLLKGL